MPNNSDLTYAGISSDAVKAKTGKGWAAWLALLDKAGAAAWSHREIANYLHDECGCPPWWSQMVTVGYEQARGLRVKHQTADGFTASASKTVNVPLADLYSAWADGKTRGKWLPSPADFTIRSTTKNKSMRLEQKGQPSIVVQFYAKGSAKSQVTIEQRKLASMKEVDRVKSFWSGALAELQAQLEGSAPGSSPRRKRKTVFRAVKKM